MILPYCYVSRHKVITPALAILGDIAKFVVFPCHQFCCEMVVDHISYFYSCSTGYYFICTGNRVVFYYCSGFNTCSSVSITPPFCFSVFLSSSSIYFAIHTFQSQCHGFPVWEGSFVFLGDVFIVYFHYPFRRLNGCWSLRAGKNICN